jgi:asparagine synthase (glutamine-hydrolysing)
VSDVAKVRAGSYVEIGPGGLRETTYWTPEPPRTRRRIPVRAAVDELEGLLRAAVHRRVTSTPSRLGVLLSGGLDSSVVAALAQQDASTPVPAFTLGFADRSFDESEQATRTARHLGLDHHLLTCIEHDLAQVVTEDVVRVDEPVADPSLLPTLLVCRAARTEVRAVLTGDGADEILFGYRFFQAEKALQLLGTAPAPLLRAAAWLARPGIGARAGNLPVRAALRQLAHGSGAPPERRYYAASAPFRAAELTTVLSGALPVGHTPFAEIDRLLDGHRDLSALDRSQLGIITHFLRDVILTKLDRAGMRHALETRSPFLDRDVVDFCAGLPTSMKLHRFTAKYVLRRLAARHLPAEIVQRRKLGFRAPVAALLRGPLRPLLLDVLTRDRLDRHGLVQPAAVARLVDDHLASRVDNSAKVWALLCFQLWHDSVLRPGRVKPPASVGSVR